MAEEGEDADADDEEEEEGRREGGEWGRGKGVAR
jgi:hypothetical protein